MRTEPPAFLVKQEEPRAQPRQGSREETAPAYEAPRAEPRPEPRIDPKKILDDSGLVMIETNRAKAPAVQYVPEEPTQVGRPRRERPKPAQPQEDELQQVETKR